MKLKIYQFVLISIFAGFLFTSCNKSIDPAPPSGNGFESLQVPDGFTWSTLNKSHFTVQIVDAGLNPSAGLNGYPLDATDLNGNLLQRVTVKEGKASYYLELNKSINDVRFYAPTHEIEHVIGLDIQTKQFPLPVNLKSVKSYTDTDGDGVFDDFDDFPSNPGLAYKVYYPSPYNKSNLKSGDDSYEVWYYQMFEDLWPSKGDYDLNDLIIKLRMVTNFDANNTWVSGTFDYYIWTNGAAINLGCGMEFFNWVGNAPDGKMNFQYLNAGQIQLVDGTYNPALTMPDPAVNNGFIIFNNADLAKGIDYWNTGAGQSADPMASHLSFDYEVTPPTEEGHMAAFMYLFYTDDRGHEVRPIGLPPTTAVTWSLLGTGSDASPTEPWVYTPHDATFSYPYDPPFYATINQHPWGIELEFDGNLKVAFEKVSIIDAFPQFKDWAESGGEQNETWYENPVNDPTKVFDVGALINTK
jgi:LruC domain-containing protein